MPYDQYGDWVQDTGDVSMSGATPGMYLPEIDMTTMMGSPDCLDGGPPTSSFESDPATTSLMPDRMGPLTKS
jgi:hypothetical protein